MIACLYAPPLVHQTSGGKYSPQNINPLQVVAQCTLVDEVGFCVARLGLCTRIGVKPTSHAQLRYYLLGQLIDEKLVTLQLARCISQVAIQHLAPLSTDEDLGTGVLVCGRTGHGRLRLGLQAFPALLGILDWDGGGVNTLLDP